MSLAFHPSLPAILAVGAFDGILLLSIITVFNIIIIIIIIHHS